jgi:hypothetical protein
VGNGKHVKRAVIGLVGAMLLVVGLAMLVLPGPGLLLVLAGLLVLASEFPALERFVDPVRERAMKQPRTAFPPRCASLYRSAPGWRSSARGSRGDSCRSCRSANGASDQV